MHLFATLVFKQVLLNIIPDGVQFAARRVACGVHPVRARNAPSDRTCIAPHQLTYVWKVSQRTSDTMRHAKRDEKPSNSTERHGHAKDRLAQSNHGPGTAASSLCMRLIELPMIRGPLAT